MKFLSWLRPKPARPISQPAMSQRKLSFQCAAVQGIGSRENQEDAYALVNATDVTKICKEGLLALVADGMGGLERGEIASHLGIQTITDDFYAMDRTEQLETQLRESVLHAADIVYGALQGQGGSTIIACILYDEQLYYAGLGDSFLYLLRDGKLIKVNREHNMRQQHYLRCIHAGRMDASVHDSIPQQGAVTSFLGIDQLDDLDWLCKALPLQEEDVLLLCSDGVSGVLNLQEIAEAMSQLDANNAAAMLQSLVLSKSIANQDNFTAVVIRCMK